MTSSNNSSPGSEARRLRVSFLLSRQELADIAGIPQAHVQLFEHNFPVPLGSKRRILQELWAIKTKA
jgi:DNA-binding transcriptional regulator YiaG